MTKPKKTTPAPVPFLVAPPPPKPSASSGVSSILANAIWKKPAPVVVAAPVYSGICSLPASLPAGGVVWRGPLAYDGASDATALSSGLESLRVACEVVARPPATGNPGAGADGISRAVAAGAVLSSALQLQWLSASAPEWPTLWEPLALLRLGAAAPTDEQGLAALEAALDANVRSRFYIVASAMSADARDRRLREPWCASCRRPRCCCALRRACQRRCARPRDRWVFPRRCSGRR
jgi:hypothetical protein